MFRLSVASVCLLAANGGVQVVHAQHHKPVIAVQPMSEPPPPPVPVAPVEGQPQPTAAEVSTVSAPAPATEDTVGFGAEARAELGGGDDLGFGDSGGSSAPREAPPPYEPSPWSLTGAIREFSAVRTEQQVLTRLASLRLMLDLKGGYTRDFMLGGAPSSFRLVAAGRGEYDFAMLNHLYDKPTREQYEWQIIPQDIYASLHTGALDVTFGKQIVPFGQGEVLSVLDVINPRDLREPVMTDPSDLRIAVLMSRVGLRMGAMNLEGIVVHEANPGLIAPPLGEFSPIRKLMLEGGSLRGSLDGHDLRYVHRPDPALWRSSSMQYHGRLSYQGAGYELSLQIASMLDPLGVATLPTANDLQLHDIDLDLFHPRYTMVGQAGTFTAGELVFRWEAAVDVNRLSSTRRVDTNLLRLESGRFTQLHGMVGLSWIPDTSTNMSLEYLQSYVLNDPSRQRVFTGPRVALLWPIEAPQFAFRMVHTFFAERASLNILMLLIGINPFNAFAGKFDFAYKITDTFQASIGYMAYHGSIQFGPLYGFGKNDRVLLSLRWDFAVN